MHYSFAISPLCMFLQLHLLAFVLHWAVPADPALVASPVPPGTSSLSSGLAPGGTQRFPEAGSGVLNPPAIAQAIY